MTKRKLFIALGFILLTIGLVFGLIVFPTYKERQRLKEKLKSDIAKEFKDFFPEGILSTLKSANEVYYGNAYYGEDNKLTFSEEKVPLKPESIPKLRDIITDPYSYPNFQNWLIEGNEYINKHYVVYPDIYYIPGFSRSYEIYPLIFLPRQYIEFRTSDSKIKLFLNESDSAIAYINSHDQWIFLILDESCMKELLSLLQSNQTKK